VTDHSPLANTLESQEKPCGAGLDLSSDLGHKTVDSNMRRASQFDPAIDKERKVIINLRWNMSPVVPDSSKYAAK
jgi:hypothetical protein